MKKYAVILCVLCCCAVFMGTARRDAPVLPMKNFYINDYEGIIDDKDRGEMLKIARELDEKTGVQLVVLTIDSYGETGFEEYSDDIFTGWEIGGAKQNGVLIIVSQNVKIVGIMPGRGFDERFSGIDLLSLTEEIENGFSDHGYSKGIFNGFSTLAGMVYANALIQPEESQADTGPSGSLAAEKQNGVIPKQKNEKAASIVVIVLAVVIALRGFRMSAKYRKRFGKGYVYKRQVFTNPYTRVGARHDDGDYPSGFGGVGGLGGYNAIKLEDIENSEDPHENDDEENTANRQADGD